MSIGDAGGRGIWLIVLETEALEGFHIGRRLQKLGHHAQDAAKLIFHKMRVPAGHLLGEIDGQGFVQTDESAAL